MEIVAFLQNPDKFLKLGARWGDGAWLGGVRHGGGGAWSNRVFQLGPNLEVGWWRAGPAHFLELG